jgi:hypothetical protein
VLRINKKHPLAVYEYLDKHIIAVKRKEKLESDNKKIIEILITPIVVALVGILGTYFITRQQIDSSSTLSNAQITSADNLAKTEQQIKVIEIFSDKITSGNKEDQELALRILRAIDSELAEKLSKAVAESEETEATIRKLALEVEEESRRKTNSKYSVAIYSLGLDSLLHDNVVDYFIQDGYQVIEHIIYDRREKWLAKQSTVLYYDESSELKAVAIAKELKNKTKISFVVRSGAGLGIPKGQEKWRFYVHVIP